MGRRGTILVTGAGGFVGSAVVRELVRAVRQEYPRLWSGATVDHVVALLRPGGSTARLEALAPSTEWSVEQADLAEPAQMLDLLRRVRPCAVVHVAADRRIFQDLTPEDLQRLHLAPLETLFTGLAEVGGERLVHTSSAWVLPAGERLDESVPPDPRSPYALAKTCADELLPTLGRCMGISWINLRLFNVFGRYESERRLLPYLVDRLSQGKTALLSSGKQVRDYTDVDDMARVYRLALQVDEQACGSVYHVGSGRGSSIRHVALQVAEQLGAPGLVRFGSNDTPDQDIVCQVANPSRARQNLGWEPRISLEIGIEQTVAWWLARWQRPTRAATASPPSS
jgi:dTDP-glucose 4,6-dehydratase